MASAFLSLPPPWSFGSADLKANARRFLQRALVISALVHLAAVGVFRAALERFAATEEPPAVIPVWRPPPEFMPPFHIIPQGWHPPVAIPDKGEIIPVQKTDKVNPTDLNFPSAEPSPVGADPRPGPSGPDNPTGPRDPSPPGNDPTFTYADTPPMPIVAPHPSYPQWAKDALIEGKVVVRVLVGTNGVPKRAIIVSGPKGLTEGIESSVLAWRFRPGLANGTPVEVWVEIPISFRLAD
jgi:protein TonB